LKIHHDIGVQIPQVHLPGKGIDLTKWAVIACDQFTSEPEYWEQVEKLVGDAPSTLQLTFPEVYLETPGEEARIRNIQKAMQGYLKDGILQPHDGLIYVERRTNGRVRKGVMLCLDLEHYDYNKGSRSLIRATEGTIVDRLPPRIKVRENAVLELPHILVLIDDPNRTVIEPLSRIKTDFEKLYDFDLMLDSGHLSGYAVNREAEGKVIDALRELASPDVFSTRYHVTKDEPALLFAMGDGNHSLATARAIWEKMKPQVGLDHPARFALVEMENVHDDGLEFEAIHRVLFGLKEDVLAEMKTRFGVDFHYETAAGEEDMVQRVDSAADEQQLIGFIKGGEFGVIEIKNPPVHLAVGTLQAFLDAFMQEEGAEKIDYVHGTDVVIRLGSEPGNAGFYLAGMHKSELFRTVILDGALPRKTFSMGEAREKRFYMEARKIS
jgi:hypothetical protein